jgi:aminoglycoside 3-N-acetyltransferase
MPTHSYCYPDSQGIAMAFDVKSTPSLVGAITNTFVFDPGVLRSIHPSHSLAAEGPLAEKLVAGHDSCETPCGTGTPYERLVNWHAGVLMFGVTLNSYTLFHTAEDAAHVPYLYERDPFDLQISAPEKERKIVRIKRQNMHLRRRFAELDAWFEQQGLLQRRNLGRGEIIFIKDCGKAHTALVNKLASDPFFLIER